VVCHRLACAADGLQTVASPLLGRSFSGGVVADSALLFADPRYL